ncbi:Proton-gated ion channel [Halioglobus japonicus]|nr:Proton-gated ion channel [Halioglobus japonicus]
MADKMTICTRLRLSIPAVFLLAVYCANTAHAIDPGMPNPPSSPTEVKLGVFLADIIDMDEVEEAFQAELILIAQWNDPRLAFDPSVEGADYKLFQGEFQFNELFTGWWPQLLIVNEIGNGDINAVRITVRPDGTVRYKDQRNVTLETPMALQSFPFDVQTLQASLISFGDYSDQVKLVVDQNVLGATEEYAEVNQKVNIAQWDLLNLDLTAGTADFRYYGTKAEFSEITMTITLERKSSNMLWKVMFPLVLLVSLMWAVFWMDIENLADRLNVAFIGILTIVAYQFLIDGSMPRISYFTFTDAVLLYSFIVMCLCIYESLLVNSLWKRGHRNAAKRIDTAAHWAFPVVYTVGLVFNFFYFQHA